MFLSRTKLASLNEADLRKEVLIPLFEAMGFQDVAEYHGSDEFGKDIVMWQKDLLRGRLNFAVVVKAKRITGAASRGQVSEICMQVRQGFGQPYIDPVSLKEQSVDRVIVVNSAAITKPARKALQIELENSRLDSRTDVIDGDILWSRIREYMPEAALWSHLERARKILNEQSGGYDVTLQISRESTSVFMSPRDGEAEPISGSLNVQFPDSLQGLERRAEYLARLKKGGKPILLSKDSLEKLEVQVPEFIKNIGPEGETTHLYIGPSRVHPPMLRRLIAQGSEGTRAVFDYIDFTESQGGEEQVTFMNNTQPIPFKFELTIGKEPGGSTLGFNFELQGKNIVHRLRSLYLMKALSEGAQLMLIDLDTDLVELEFRVEPGEYAPPDPLEFACISALVVIQNRTGKTFSVQRIDGEQSSKIFFAAAALSTGRAALSDASFDLAGLPEGPDQGTWADLLGQKTAFRVNSENETVTILGEEISLGPSRWLYQGTVGEETVEGVRRLFLRATPSRPFRGEFPRWLPSDTAPEAEPAEPRAAEPVEMT